MKNEDRETEPSFLATAGSTAVMRNSRWLWRIEAVVAAILLGSLWSAPAAAQQQVGRCTDQSRGQSFGVLQNGMVFQEGNPGNAGMSVRDPSGMAFLRMPAVLPWQQAFFVGWRGELVEVNPTGWRVIGGCQFRSDVVPANPNADVNARPAMHPSLGVPTPQGFMPLPQQIVDPNNPFARPMIASEARTLACYQSSGGDRAQFGDCMVRAMVGQREAAVYQCARGGVSSDAIAICMVGALGGQREQQLAVTLGQCRQRYGADYSKYPLCMASMPVGGDAGKLLACVQQQRGQATVMGTAVCYGASSLNLNPEMQIIAQCAVATGGEPYSFAGCAGGQLTARELDKCFTNGVGGQNGCFGPNNDIVRALSGLGDTLRSHFGPSNTLVQTWNSAVNDLTHGPGPNHVVLQTFRNVGNEAQRASQNIGREISRAMPRIRVRF
jgi:hypothetical protein